MPYEDLEERIHRAHRAHRLGKTVLDIRDGDFEGLTWKPGTKLPPVHLRFTRVKFHGDLVFKDVVFPSGVSFIDVDFCDEASFAYCHFEGPAYFWKCRFHKKADFKHIVVACANFSESHYDAGETNFGYSTFTSKADFRHAVLCGPTYFWRTVFMCEVDFQVAQFRAATQFMGRCEDILVSERELPKGVSESLCKAKVLCKCEDRENGYYNFSSDITSQKVLTRHLRVEMARMKALERLKRKAFQLLRTSTRLIAHNIHLLPVIMRTIQSIEQVLTIADEPALLNSEDVEKIKELWNGYHRQYMFNNNNEFTHNFMEVYFAPKSEFRHVSLRRCKFRRADLSNVRFDSVIWDKTYMGRERIFDEVFIEANIKEFLAVKPRSKEEGEWIYPESIAVSNLYHQLRSRADVAGERSLARNFYYGEMEMARQAELPSGRSVLPSMYKYLSGYGTQELKAMAILLVLMLGVWPIFYMSLDVYSVVYRQHYCLERWSLSKRSLLRKLPALKPPPSCSDRRSTLAKEPIT